VTPGRRTGPPRVARHQGLDDIGVLADRSGRPPRDRECRLHAPGQDLLKDHLGSRQKLVAGVLGDTEMEFGVHRLHICCRHTVGHSCLQLPERGQEVLELLIGGCGRGPARGGDFEHLPHCEQFVQADVAHSRESPFGELALGRGGDEDALAVPYRYRATALQGPERLAHRCAAYPEQVTQLPFPRQPIAGAEPVAVDMPLDLIGYPLEQRLG
jgi:hypothetical protein